jgi:replication factor A1
VICNDFIVVDGETMSIGQPENIMNINPSDLEKIRVEFESQKPGSKMDTDSLMTPMSSSSSKSSRDVVNPYKKLMSNSEPVQKHDVPIEDAVIPINMLNPYNNRWTIKARVTNKGPLRTWNNSKGTGKLFSIDLLDESEGEIRATMFNDAADKFYNLFEQDKVYFISKGQVKMANKQYTSHLSSDYELTLNNDAEVVLANDTGNIKKIKFSFEPISQIGAKPKDTIIDIIGVVTKVGDRTNIVSQKTNRELSKRVLTIADESRHSIEITLWGSLAELNSDSVLSENAVIAIKGCRVGDYGGRSLSSLAATYIEVNPDRPEAHRLRGWWDSQGSSSPITELSGQKAAGGSGAQDKRSFAQMKEESMGNGDQAAFYRVTGTLTNLTFSAEKLPWYTACPSPQCNKKVSEDSQGNWFCEKCNKAYPNCEPRYILSFQCSDFSDSVRLRAFNEVAQSIVGNHPASQLKEFLDSGEESRIESIFNACNFQSFNLAVKAKMEMVQDQQRVAFTVVGCTLVNHVKDCAHLLDRIQEYGL